ncbi:MAG: CPBP family intramembrane metalloprotease [Geodermatophilaceae bacterium]|nr:CPBP family intramembrane metalloprotease [Geodermatophilaceae bacterium]
MAVSPQTALPETFGIWGPPGANKARRSRPEPRSQPWGLGEVAAGFVALLVAQVLLTVAFATVAARRISLDGSPEQLSLLVAETLSLALGGPGLVVGLLTQWAAFLGAALYASYRKGRRSLGLDFGLRFRWPTDLLLGLALAVVLQVVLLVLNVGLAARGVDVSAADNTGLVTSNGGMLLVLLIAGAVVGAPLVEELFFRGLFLRALLRRLAKVDLADPHQSADPEHTRRRTVGTALSILLTAVVFGALHAPFSGSGNSVPIEATLLLGAQTGLLGLVFAVVAVRVRRIGPTVVAHVSFNAISIALALLSLV